MFSVTALPDFHELIEEFSYLGIFIWFVFLDQITPIPEEVVLVTMGFAANAGLIDPVIAGGAALAGLLIVDNFYYGIGRSGKILFKRLQKPGNQVSLQKFQDRLQEHDWQTIIFMCFFPKLRFFMPFLVAAAGIRWGRFAIFNAIGSAGYVTLYLLLGIFFEQQLRNIELEKMVIIIFIFALLVGIFVFFNIFRKAKAQPPSENTH